MHTKKPLLIFIYCMFRIWNSCLCYLNKTFVPICCLLWSIRSNLSNKETFVMKIYWEKSRLGSYIFVMKKTRYLLWKNDIFVVINDIFVMKNETFVVKTLSVVKCWDLADINIKYTCCSTLMELSELSSRLLKMRVLLFSKEDEDDAVTVMI